MDKPLWRPSEQQINDSNLSNFSKLIGFDQTNDFKKIWKWSVSKPEIFWSRFWDYSKIIGEKGSHIIKKDKVFNKTKFFPNSKLNYSENILKIKNNDIAINFYLKLDLKKVSRGTCCMKSM